MSKIDDLIQQLCPNGVEFKTLGDVGDFIRGNGMLKSDLTNEGFPAIHYGQVHTTYGISAESTVSFVTAAFASKIRKAKPGDLIIATTSEDDDAVAKALAWVGTTEVAVSGDAYIYRHRLEPKYVSYFFQSDQFQAQKKSRITGAKVKRISGESMAKIRIPVPPIEVQCEIVRVLDAFSKLEEELEAQLEAEMALRRSQVAIYRRNLLVSHTGHCTTGKLREVAHFRNAKAHEKLVDPNGEIALLTSRFVSTQGRMVRYVRKEHVLTPAFRGETALVMSDLPKGRALAKAFYVDHDDRYAANQRVGLLKPKDSQQLDSRFLFYMVDRNPQLLAYDNGLDQTHLKKDWILDVVVPIPDIEMQRKIVSSLDSLIAGGEVLDQNLVKELGLRRQQYEHYRDRLLTFEEAT